ncbi:hypothetical protein VNO78_02336 [Psophocarpus tetragonolobus]|uniref:Uncharacterized protein n=1 Tax=Psophocarpus tetragonolobus TaxID=3891 RepID=A0AAN9TAF9_PSOTE
MDYGHFADDLSLPLSPSPIPNMLFPSLTTTLFPAPPPCTTPLWFLLASPSSPSPSPTNLHLAQTQFHILVNGYAHDIVSEKWPINELELTSRTCISVNNPSPSGMQPVNYLSLRLENYLSFREFTLKLIVIKEYCIKILAEKFLREGPKEVVEKLLHNFVDIHDDISDELNLVIEYNCISIMPVAEKERTVGAEPVEGTCELADLSPTS